MSIYVPEKAATDINITQNASTGEKNNIANNLGQTNAHDAMDDDIDNTFTKPANEESSCETINTDDMGSWMFITYKKGTKKIPSFGLKNSLKNGSRFNVLQEESIDIYVETSNAINKCSN